LGMSASFGGLPYSVPPTSLCAHTDNHPFRRGLMPTTDWSNTVGGRGSVIARGRADEAGGCARPAHARGDVGMLSELRRPAGTEELDGCLALHPNGVRVRLGHLRKAGLVRCDRTRRRAGGREILRSSPRRRGAASPVESLDHGYHAGRIGQLERALHEPFGLGLAGVPERVGACV
jgi:hypothetical protein